MSTTVVDVPSDFDEVSINRILGEDKFEKGELHPHQIADVWGFVKYFYKEEGQMQELPLSEFRQLCKKVEKDELRYEVNSVGPLSPNRLARQISARGSNSHRKNTGKSQDINLNRIEEQNGPVIPAYSVRDSEEKVSVVFDDEVYLSRTNEIVGKDCFGNEYRLDINQIHDKLSENTESVRSFKNGVTTLEFHV